MKHTLAEYIYVVCGCFVAEHTRLLEEYSSCWPILSQYCLMWSLTFLPVWLVYRQNVWDTKLLSGIKWAKGETNNKLHFEYTVCHHRYSVPLYRLLNLTLWLEVFFTFVECFIKRSWNLHIYFIFQVELSSCFSALSTSLSVIVRGDSRSWEQFVSFCVLLETNSVTRQGQSSNSHEKSINGCAWVLCPAVR